MYLELNIDLPVVKEVLVLLVPPTFISSEFVGFSIGLFWSWKIFVAILRGNAAGVEVLWVCAIVKGTFGSGFSDFTASVIIDAVVVEVISDNGDEYDLVIVGMVEVENGVGVVIVTPVAVDGMIEKSELDAEEGSDNADVAPQVLELVVGCSEIVAGGIDGTAPSNGTCGAAGIISSYRRWLWIGGCSTFTGLDLNFILYIVYNLVTWIS